MYHIYYPYPATDGKHKWFIITNKGKIIKFGSYGLMDFVMYNKQYDKEYALDKKKAYLARHGKLNEDWSNPDSRAYWAVNLLWNLPTIKESYRKIKDDLRSRGYL